MLEVEKVYLLPPVWTGAAGPGLSDDARACCSLLQGRLKNSGLAAPSSGHLLCASPSYSKTSLRAERLRIDPSPLDSKNNDVLAAGSWKVDKIWSWDQQRHINSLETESVVSLHRDLVRDEPDSRPVCIVDSTDDPTRSVRIREPVSSCILECLSERGCELAAKVGGLSKPRANWVRVAILLNDHEGFLEALSFREKRLLKMSSCPLDPCAPSEDLPLASLLVGLFFRGLTGLT